MREIQILQMTAEMFAKRMPMVFEWNAKTHTVSFSKCSIVLNLSSLALTWQGQPIDDKIPTDMTPTLCKWITDFVATCPRDLHESLRNSTQSLACGLNSMSDNTTPLAILRMQLVISLLSSLLTVRL
jgi:hypothetical protein